jgi:exopolysaccharide production protein ExoQ
MWMLAATSAVSVALSNRPLNVAEGSSYFLATSNMAGGLITKGLLLLAIGYSVGLCAVWTANAMAMGRMASGSIRITREVSESRSDIVIGFMAFYIAVNVVPIFFGNQFYFHVSLVYPFFIYLALFLWLQVSDVPPINVAKQCLGLIVFGSLLFAVIFPQLSIQFAYRGMLPGFEGRLWGLAATANGLGAVASGLLLIEIAEPSRKKWLRCALVIGATSTLFMSQSKTAILTTLVGLAIIFCWRLVPGFRGLTSVHRSIGDLTAIGLIFSFCALVSVIGFGIMFSDGDALSSITRHLDSRGLDDLTTATGRTWIWEAAIDAGLENPLFGQGANYWNQDSRLRLGLSGATHAHNLLLEVFTRAGLVGVAALFVFLYLLVRYTQRAANPTSGGSVALLVVFALRAVTEVPIQPNGILGAEFFSTMALIFYVMDRGARRAAPNRSDFRWKQIRPV